MSDVERNVSREIFRKIFPVKILISGYKHNYFGAR